MNRKGLGIGNAGFVLVQIGVLICLFIIFKHKAGNDYLVQSILGSLLIPVLFILGNTIGGFQNKFFIVFYNMSWFGIVIIGALLGFCCMLAIDYSNLNLKMPYGEFCLSFLFMFILSLMLPYSNSITHKIIYFQRIKQLYKKDIEFKYYRNHTEICKQLFGDDFDDKYNQEHTKKKLEKLLQYPEFNRIIFNKSEFKLSYFMLDIAFYGFAIGIIVYFVFVGIPMPTGL